MPRSKRRESYRKEINFILVSLPRVDSCKEMNHKEGFSLVGNLVNKEEYPNLLSPSNSSTYPVKLKSFPSPYYLEFTISKSQLPSIA